MSSPSDWVPWRFAWQRALYGAHGFYRRGRAGPAGHFATATQGAPRLGEVMAAAVVRLARSEGLDTLVDVGCGRGELLLHVAEQAPELRCIGVEVAPRPASLPRRTGWMRSPGGPDLPDQLARLSGALVLANEWLDVVPCTLAEVDDAGGLREREVRPRDGAERLADSLCPDDEGWAAQHWPTHEPGDRVEVGRARDLALRELADRVQSGLVVAVDYGHRRSGRPREGTLTGFREGVPVAPLPDGSCDLTAHVAMDSLGCDELVDQRTALRRLGAVGSPPSIGDASTDPRAYLDRLAISSAQAALTAQGGFGDFLWAIIRR